MRRTTLLVTPLAGLLVLAVAFPGVASAAPAPTVSFSASSYTVSESAGNATITATRHGGGRAVTVNFATHWGTARPSRDYATTVRTVTIPAGAGSASADVPVPVKDNSVADADRSFTVTLARPTRYTLTGPSTARVTIVNDDAPAAPAALTATAHGSDEIDLAWTANSDHVTGYQVWRSTTSGGPYTSAGTSATNSYSDTGLAAGTYYYVVQAVNPAGSSPNSNEASATLGPTELIYNGGFENGFTSWVTNAGPGTTITLDTSAPHSGSQSAHLATDAGDGAATLTGSFTMPSSGTVTFTAWYRAALAASRQVFVSLYDYDAGGYLSSVALPSAADWTQTVPVSIDASTVPGHYIAVVVDLQGTGDSTLDVDDFSALTG